MILQNIYRNLLDRYLISRMSNPGYSLPRVSYAYDAFPMARGFRRASLRGGAVKYGYLDEVMPHSGNCFNILYAVSSSHCRSMALCIEKTRETGGFIVWNQNGAYFPSAYGNKVAARGNREMAGFLHAADHVFYQSKFAKMASDYFLGRRDGPSEILYNAVDTSLFKPLDVKKHQYLVLLAAGSHNDEYRLSLALTTLFLVRKRCKDASLLVAGKIPSRYRKSLDAQVRNLGVENSVVFGETYPNSTAPIIFNSAHILLHTQYNDVCPTTVIEAMACGLPVVYSKSGGTPELVGEKSGVGISSDLNWQKPLPPDAEALAAAVINVADSLDSYSKAARERAVRLFDIKPWLQRHSEVFTKLIKEGR